MEQEAKIAHLPQQFTSFVGRERELSEVSQLLANPSCRLLTLTGPGGIGKTRLALEATAVNAHHFAHGAAFVNLQPIHEPEFLISAIADALQITLSGSETSLAQLSHYLADKEILLTLDNFEQLLALADVLSSLLQVSPVRFLITSREALNLQEEWLYPLHGLPVPDDASEGTAAVQLFTERARRVQPGFVLTDVQADVVAICRLVEGMPLAIELAAAWVRSLSCVEILAEIKHSLDFLTTRLRNVLPRHRSILAIFDQAWQQLTVGEQMVFQQLTVFRGGFRRGAATAVAHASLAILSNLVDKSLLRWESEGPSGAFYGRYQIHELLRQYAEEKLQSDAAQMADTLTRHSQYYAQFLSKRLDDLLGGRQRGAMLEIETELENVRAAWQWAIKHTALTELEQITVPMMSFYWFQSRFLEARNAYQSSIVCLQDMDASRSRDSLLALLYSNFAWFLMGTAEMDEAYQAVQQSYNLHQQYNLSPAHGLDTDPRLALGDFYHRQGELEKALALFLDVSEDARQRHDLINWQTGVRLSSEIYLTVGQLDKAQECGWQAYQLARQIEDRWGTAYGDEVLGDVAFARQDYEQAEQHYLASYEIRLELQFRLGIATVLRRLGNLALRRQAYQQAHDYYHESLTIYRQHNLIGGEIGALMSLGKTAVAAHNLDSARAWLIKAIQILSSLETQIVDVAILTLIESGHYLLLTGQPETAVALFAFALPQPSLLQDEREAVQELLAQGHGALAEARYETAVAYGQNTPLETHLDALQNLLAAPLPDQPAIPAPPIDQPLVDPLTPRELEVLQLIAGGYTNQQIADELVISLGTVKYYTSHIYSKLGVSHRTQAVAHARDIGLI